MDAADKEIIADFVIESQEGLAHVETQMLAIEAAGADIDGDLVNAVFRTMHSIKGAAGFLGLDRIGSLAHGLEEVLNDLRNRELIPTSELVSTVLRAADFMKGLIDAVDSSNDADVSPFVAELQQLREAEKDADSQSDEAPTNASRLGEYLVEQGKVDAEHVQDALERQRQGDPLRVGEILVESGVIKSQDVREALHTLSENKSAAIAETNIRVDVGLLDKLMNLVGELVLARNQILQFTATEKDNAFLSTTQRLNLITTELQEGVMKTRMQPIGNVWSKFPRIVRDLASQLDKQVRFEMEGKETELDKTIVEAIKDPLTHLVRNAVDHGIESPAARIAAGKPAEGTLLMRAFHEGGQVNIEISDDGAGLNLERIRKKAIERGLIGPEQAARMSDREASQLILLPGFSTAEKVTSLSGRGVGMDVVKTNIERIGGTLDLQSEFGRGMTVKIKIPLTLAIIPALVVTNDGERYAIPQVSLLELVRLEGEQAARGIELVHGAPVYRLRGKLLPLVNLSERLDQAKPENNATDADRVVNIVVLAAHDRQFGLIVDKVNDTEEIVVKPLSRQLKSLSEYAGATIMGDGTVALILDVMGLAVAAGLTGEIRDKGLASGATSNEQGSEEIHSMLVVDLGDERRFAMPTSMVSRLEKLPRTSIEHADDREVIQYRGDIMPLVRLSEVFGGGNWSQQEPEELQIVVYASEEGPCGLVVNRIVDIVETELRFHSRKEADENLLGTAVIQQRVTDVLNLKNLARHASRRSCTA